MPIRAPALHTTDILIRGPIARTDLPGLCDRVCRLLAERGAGLVRCDVRGVEPDAVVVEALARLQLAAGRHGCRVRLRGASPGLLELVRLMGLENVLACESETGGDEFPAPARS